MRRGEEITEIKKEAYLDAAEKKPSQRQLLWQKMEFYAFVHFGLNTFTDKEWGDGTDDPKLFNPESCNPYEWVKIFKSAGMKGVILTCKHHDGFCLWQSEYTDYSVKSSPYKDGKGDIVKEVSDACRQCGLKFGIYLSPWDRHEKTYGTYEYNDFYKNQLRELLLNYGEIFAVWIDGANGEKQNGKKQTYDYKGIFELIRELQPNAVIANCGPDIRWIGNEQGKTRKQEWSVVPTLYLNSNFVSDNSQKKVGKPPKAYKKDIGSRKAIKNISAFCFYPAETDVSIRPGWFYHEKEDFRVKNEYELWEIYKNSVGNNSALLLNVPPNKKGLLSQTDVESLIAFGNKIKYEFSLDLVKYILPKASSESSLAVNVIAADDSFWCPEEFDVVPQLIFDFENIREIRNIVLKEHIADGQFVERFEIYSEKNGSLKRIYKGFTIGYKKIISFKKPVFAEKLIFKFKQYRKLPEIESISIY